MEYSYRIKANVGVDQVLNVNLKQDIDIYEILSLSLDQNGLYKLFPDGSKNGSSLGVIVGRVLANDAFGVPNVKVTVFIPLSDVDSLRPDIRAIYPYKAVTDVDSRNVKFNTLPNYKKFECHQEVGSFPKKRLVLDNDSILEVYDKYYKYTTITNKAGDYMIFGIPTGEQILHVDVDLSDVGILSQEPRDFIYKGYSIDLFESPTQFKRGTNLDNLAQIQNQTTTVTVYPLWGDKSSGEIAITRKDINLQYKFEPTCVFLGSVITDNGQNFINHNCIPDEHLGEAGQLGPSKGNIEMIRKTVDDKIEEYPIRGNQLIDGDGTWCYQIPMNLDYVGMDEYGNIVPTDNPNKGIPTRARVRFRITLDDTGDDSLSVHKARYLVPNNPELYHGYVKPTIHRNKMDNDLYYEFGTLTPEDCFRDLYWNKVYSVKNYIPRLQMSEHEKTTNYLAIKGVNKRDARKNNPIPFNKINLNITETAYNILSSVGMGNSLISGFWRYLSHYSVAPNIDEIREKILDENDGIGLDFYNDWLNGCLYFPSWYWHSRYISKGTNGESVRETLFCECKEKDDNINGKKLFLYNNCSLVYEDVDMSLKIAIDESGSTADPHKFYELFNDMYTSIPFGSKNIYSGIIKQKKNIDGLSVFYYSFGNKLSEALIEGNTEYNSGLSEVIMDDEKPTDGRDYYEYARLFSTDIILLGSLKDCDIDGVPKIGFNIPSTTSNIPPMGAFKKDKSKWPEEADDNMPEYDTNDLEEDLINRNGMNWGEFWHNNGGEPIDIRPYEYKFGSGLFFGLTAKKTYVKYDWLISLVLKPWAKMVGTEIKRIDIIPFSDIKTCVNVERICELGVTNDNEGTLEYKTDIDDESYEKYIYYINADGLITKHEIIDTDARALFATLNSNKLKGVVENEFTGYKKYNLVYYYPTNFDGRLEKLAPDYTSNITSDDRNKDYLDFRFGSNSLSFLTCKKSLFDSIVDAFIDIMGIFSNAFKGPLITTDDIVPRKYVVYDGYANISKQIIPRTRHFYGYNNGIDSAYPLKVNQNSFTDYEYAFPLYNNSFYFYFGINQGSTAIDKFYEQFYSKCYYETELPFTLSIKTKPARSCNAEPGEINVAVNKITYPYNISLMHNGVVIEEKIGVAVRNVSFSNLSNGQYQVFIEDSYGNSLRENVSLLGDKVTISFSVKKNITIDTTSVECDEVCSNEAYAELSIDFYTSYGAEYEVEQLSGDNGKYKLNDSAIWIEIYNIDGGDACICGNEENIIKIGKAGTYTIKAYKMCNESEGTIDNITYYTVTISEESIQSDNTDEVIETE